MQIKAIFFDIDDTLLDFHACAKKAMQCALAEQGVPFTPALFSIFQTINQMLWQKIEQGEITKAQLRETRWNLIFQTAGLSLAGPAFEERFLAHLENCAYPLPHAYEILKILSAKYPLFAASNAPFAEQKNRLRLAGMLPFFADLFTSEKMGHAKPDRAFFDACFARLPGLAPGETLLIGDSLAADIAGGAGYGMRTCWLNRKRLPLPENFQGDQCIFSLEELKNL